jgi:exonuclease SbcC
MQLHALTVTAFGPFADSQYVDFDALAAGGLFLFHGPTGAGKTSILDAVCFALYGQVPGSRSGSRALRSDHAGPGTRPEVVLETTVRGRRLRITRSPQWDRPKRRGAGTTLEQSRVHLEERTGETWTSLSTRLDEAGHLIGRLLGLTMTQFCQVVLLPQGQFAEFLRADADRRRAVLESLFDTERFSDVERWLVERRKTSARALEEADQRISPVVARAAEAGGAELLPDAMPPGETSDWVDALLTSARAAAAVAVTEARRAEKSRDAAVSTLAAATRLGELQLTRRRLLARQADLRVRRAERDAAVAEVEAARSVAPILPLLADVGRLQTQLEEVRGAALSVHAEVAGFLAATGTSGSPSVGVSAVGTGGASATAELPPVTVVATSAAAMRAEVGNLQRLADHEAEADRLVRDTDALERTIVAIEAEVSEVTGWLDDVGPRRAGLLAEREESRAAAARLPVEQQAQAQAMARLGAARTRDALRDQAAGAADELRGHTDLAQQAREDWLVLRQARLDGMAAELAAGLLPGDSCPVCGSSEHPVVATATPGAVTRAQEDEAAARSAAAERSRTQAQERLGSLEVALAEARAGAGGDEPVDALAAWAAETTTRVQATTVQADRLELTEKAVHDLDQERETRVRQQVRLAQQREQAGARATEQHGRLVELQAVLSSARGDDPSLAARTARLLRLADDCDRLAAQIGDTERLQSAVGAALLRAETAAAESPLGTLAAVTAAVRDDSRVTELEEFRQRHDAELATVIERLDDPDLSGVDNQPEPELDVLRAAAQVAETGHTTAVAALTGARNRVDALERLLGGVRDLLAARGPLAAEHATVDGLSRLAEGKSADNRLRMSLSGYVLAARLEQVAAAASERLLRMSSGRYRLAHAIEGGSARERGGLHLRVLDEWTGADRDPATLSGGESFSASLALALGLADVVSQEAGGSLLETLFVDEGFGTLDDDTLDEVMGVLDDLREGGRVVGLVSHVADLRQRIPVQLRVEKGRTGSSIRQ